MGTQLVGDEEAASAASRIGLRVGAYLLLADLLETGPTSALRPALRASPILEKAVAAVRDADELEASHMEAFGFQAFPFSGVFLDPSAQAGAGGEALQGFYTELHFDAVGSGPASDHLSVILRALAHGCCLEADALAAGADTKALQAAMRRLIDEQVFPWVPLWVAAVRRLDEVWSRALADQIWGLLAFHRTELGEGTSTSRRAMEPLPDLSAETTDLRAIAEALTAPARCGLLLTRRDIADLARQVQAPTGFGGRSLLLENALQSASRYDTLPELLDRMASLCESSAAELETDFDNDAPGVRAATEPVRRRLPEVARLLRRMKRAARTNPR